MKVRPNHILKAVFVVLAVILFVPAMAQNTKGDRPLDNRGKVRQTHGKSVKKKGKATTKDIAGRRLRTKNKSSANRANVGIPQPITTSRQPRRRDDRAARAPLNKRYSSRAARKSDPDRQWQGDISGYKPRKIKPSSAEETGRNVYPQGKYSARHPKPQNRPFKGYGNKTASGKPIVKRTPGRSNRAWKGDKEGLPFFAPFTYTGRTQTVFRQRTSRYVNKHPSPRDRSFSDRGKGFGASPRGSNLKRGGILSIIGQGPFVTRGKKNVYWGKFKVGGKAKTRDVAGNPLRNRNFRSSGIGLTGRDTLKFFGRNPHGDIVGVPKRKGKFLPGSEAKGGWLNDIAGYRLRKKIPGGAEAPDDHKYSGFRSISGKFRTNGKLQGKTPGIGAAALSRGLNKTKGADGRNFQDQGGGFSGFLKLKRQGNYHGNPRGGLWNNNGSPIPGKAIPLGGIQAGRFSGKIRGGPNKNFGDQGSGYSGDVKQGKRGKFIGSYRHKLWNNDRTPVGGKLLPGNPALAGRFSGKIRGGPEKNYTDQGSGYAGDRKQIKKGKFVGSYGHKLWNNGGKATTEIGTTGAGALAGTYQGHTRPKARGKGILVPSKLWNNNGQAVTEIGTTRAGALAGTYQGHTRPKARGKAILIPGKLWNNNGKAVTEIQSTKAGALAGSYHGHTKVKEKGKYIDVPNKLWNNSGKAVTAMQPTKAGAAAGLYQGHQKAKKPVKYPLNSSTIVWNNNGKATTQIKLTSAGASAGKFQGNTKYHKENKKRDSGIESKMKIKENYVQNPHSVDEAIKKQKPDLNYKAGNFASGAKVIGKRRHNPNSVDDAIDSYHNSAAARRVDYQGNVKMRKFVDRRQSPDAKFIHSGENNVKEDRTIMTNVKLFWAKLFQKSDSQPSNLKERSNKLRYDKGEKGMWAD